LRSRLREELRLAASIGGLWSLLREMGLRLKKSRYTLPSKTLSPSGSGARSGASE